ncbi:MAG: endonuclease/exonuclease/phosphatase family protein [Pseudomonadota bacterium]
MKLLSLNAWGGRLHDRLIPFLRDRDPDVLCLQEVTRAPAPCSAWVEYRDAERVLPQRADLFRDVAAALPEHDGVFCACARGVLFDGAREAASHWGLATFVRRDLAMVGQAQAFVHGGFLPEGFGPHPRPRNSHGVRVWDAAAGRFVTVVQVHGLRDARGKGDTPERAAQARRLLALLQGLAEAGDLRVVCGDFNLRPDSETFDLLRGAGLRDLVTEGGHDGTRTSLYAKAERFADYLLTDGAPLGFEVVRAPEVSDHCPLALEI